MRVSSQLASSCGKHSRERSMAFSVGGLLLGLINEIRINLPLSQELIDRIDAALGPDKYRTGLIREALRRELDVKPQEVVPSQTKSADGRLACEASMGPVPVV